uniref:Ixodegrin B n=1 Tax=Rhipicephalus zambeziensis TaxID=60191 RepID=A0A224YLL9_9ACAR
MCHLSSVAIFLTVAILCATSTVTKCSGTKGSDDGYVEWGSTDGNECEGSSECGDGKCCLNNDGQNSCQLRAPIGKPCSPEADFNAVYNTTCPCESPYPCKDKGENISICAPPEG